MSAFTKAEKFVASCLEVGNDLLPESYRGKRSTRKLSSVISQFERTRKSLNKDPNEVSVKFDENGNVKSGTSERLARLNVYRQQIENGAETLEYVNVNESKLEGNCITFCNVAVKAGWLEADDFIDE